MRKMAIAMLLVTGLLLAYGCGKAGEKVKTATPTPPRASVAQPHGGAAAAAQKAEATKREGAAATTATAPPKSTAHASKAEEHVVAPHPASPAAEPTAPKK